MSINPIIESRTRLLSKAQPPRPSRDNIKVYHNEIERVCGLDTFGSEMTSMAACRELVRSSVTVRLFKETLINCSLLHYEIVAWNICIHTPAAPTSVLLVALTTKHHEQVKVWTSIFPRYVT
jgi:hypothetical protein